MQAKCGGIFKVVCCNPYVVNPSSSLGQVVLGLTHIQARFSVRLVKRSRPNTLCKAADLVVVALSSFLSSY